MKPLLFLAILIIGHCIRERLPQFRGVTTVNSETRQSSLSSHSHFQPSQPRDYLIQLKQSIKLSSLLHELYDVDMTIVGKTIMFIIGVNMYCTNIFMIFHISSKSYRPCSIFMACIWQFLLMWLPVCEVLRMYVCTIFECIYIYLCSLREF